MELENLTFKKIFLIYVILLIMDIILTAVAYNTKVMYEYNPIGRYLLNRVGNYTFIIKPLIFDFPVLLLISSLMTLLKPNLKKFAFTLYTSIYVMGLSWNIIQLIKEG